MIESIDKFIHDQMSVWPELAAAHRALKSVQTRQEEVGGLKVTLQHNPSRIASSVVDVKKKKDICLLCAENRPREQRSLPIEGRKGRKYEILLNRYPVFPNHLVIVRDVHTPQTIWHRYVDMLDMAAALQDYVILYNGPVSGASIPEHMHFQACPKGYMPLERAIDRCLGDVEANLGKNIEYIASVQDARLYHYLHFARGIFCLKAATAKSMAKLFYRLLDCAPIAPGESEPRFNAVTYFAEGEYRAIVMCRTAHRSHHYFSSGEDHLTMSPGVVDMGGIFIVPDPADFRKVTPQMLSEMLSEVAISEENEKMLLWRLVRTQPRIEVGIMSEKSITFEIISDGAGPQTVSFREGKIDYNGVLYDSLVFEAVTISTLFAEPSFILHDVVIGKDFHWQRKVDQRFAGTLKFIPENGKVTAIDVIGVEDYLVSVISSEMSADAPLEFLKAHAVISRSWVMSRIASRKRHAGVPSVKNFTGTPSLVTWLESRVAAETLQESSLVKIWKWTDDSLHKRFDVCADDHCQRYQGLPEPSSENPTALTPAQAAVDATWGMVLTYGGEIADARFSKCCGGKTELFSSAWQDRDYPYLVSRDDSWCDTSDREVLSAVLKDYDRETNDFHDWKVSYGISELSEIIRSRSGVDIGEIQELRSLQRGPSGRIIRLLLRGSLRSMEVGKELMIRKILSRSHLYSSAFDAEISGGKVILSGHGWGHGVGLCQIGAAVMASRGKSYSEILSFYYPGTIVENDWNI